MRHLTAFSLLLSACGLILLDFQSVLYLCQLKSGLCLSISPIKRVALMEIRLPSFNAVRILPTACEASKALLILGRANDMGLSLGWGLDTQYKA